jgi:hypothetical protein
MGKNCNYLISNNFTKPICDRFAILALSGNSTAGMRAGKRRCAKIRWFGRRRGGLA